MANRNETSFVTTDDTAATTTDHLNPNDIIKTCSKYSTWATVVLAVAAAALAFVTIAGNSLVIYSFFKDVKLRTFGNYFILNLALADLVIGLLICLYTPYFLSGCWRLGRAGCIAFNVVDYVTPLTSAWTMAVISLDRYCSVAYPIQYRMKKSARLAAVFMVIPWLVGTAVYLPSVVFWEYYTGRQAVPDGSCFVEFYDNERFLAFSSVMEYLIPFGVVSVANMLIYVNIRRRMRTASFSNANSGAAAAGYANRDAATALARDRKSARSLAILVGVFLVTWAPYDVCSLVNPICGFCVPDAVFDVGFWLLWINSTVNPILYPFLQKKFRVAFVKVLCCGRKNKVGAVVWNTAT